MPLDLDIKIWAHNAIKDLFNREISVEDLAVTPTNAEFLGDYTLVTFSLAKILNQKPEHIASGIGEFLSQHYGDTINNYNVVKGFLNLGIMDCYWTQFLNREYLNTQFGLRGSKPGRIMVEYSSPNTNKPLHLGHLRNNFVGWSVAEILKANGYQVVKTCVVNDRGIHICKSMIAWQTYGNGATPQTTGIKGDHLVGDYYVKFNEVYNQQVDELVGNGLNRVLAEREAPIMKATQTMLKAWEGNDPDVRRLWETMNGWVYAGFDETYSKIGTDFDKVYFESQTYLLGKQLVNEGLSRNLFFIKNDGSVWVDLKPKGLDEKLLLRSDGTSVYITQDLGLAKLKFEEFYPDKSIYVVGDEQNYHLKVLFCLAAQLEIPPRNGFIHLSYGMVELPSGKMKSREGTVVDADDLIQEMIVTSAHHTNELGKVEGFSDEELKELYEIIGMGALKFFLLRVDPKKRIVFNPEESIDFHGFTGPFVQYTFARIQSILKKESDLSIKSLIIQDFLEPLLPLERQLLVFLERFPGIIVLAGTNLDPSLIALAVFNLARSFNTFYGEHSISKAESKEKRSLRLGISILTARALKLGMSLLGIRMPDRM